MKVMHFVCRVCAIITATGIIMYLFTGSVTAEYQGWGTDNYAVFYYTPSYNSVWSDPLTIARSEWNNPFCGVLVGSTTSTTESTLTVVNSSDSWYGLCIQEVASPFMFSIMLNSRTIAADAITFSSFVRSVVVHELGHVFWLKDNPNTSRQSIMKGSRNRNTMVSEQAYDREDVDAIF